jgi:hypothetical protein
VRDAGLVEAAAGGGDNAPSEIIDESVVDHLSLE